MELLILSVLYIGCREYCICLFDSLSLKLRNYSIKRTSHSKQGWFKNGPQLITNFKTTELRNICLCLVFHFPAIFSIHTFWEQPHFLSVMCNFGLEPKQKWYGLVCATAAKRFFREESCVISVKWFANVGKRLKVWRPNFCPKEMLVKRGNSHQGCSSSLFKILSR